MWRHAQTFIPLVLGLIAVLIMIQLGFWQLNRYDEKQQILLQFHERQQQPPALVSDVIQLSESSGRIALDGRFLMQPQWLLENQVDQRQLGVQVLSLFELENGQRILVNRGFISVDQQGNPSTDFQIESGKIRINGVVYLPGRPWTKPDSISIDKPVNRLPVLDSEQFLDRMADPHLASVFLRLDPSSLQGFKREWQVVAGQPEKHRAYAFQWFVMAAVLSVIFTLYYFRKFQQQAVNTPEKGMQYDTKQ